MKGAILALLGFVLLCAACAPRPSPDPAIQLAVAQTLAAVPTQTPYPRPTAASTPTAASLSGLFCEYQFCIGHPPDSAFFDVKAQRDPQAPSTFSQGILAAYTPSLFLELIWQDATGAGDAHFMFDVILDAKVDTPSGTPAPLQIANQSILFLPIRSTASNELPYGDAAAWLCGGRAFAWKVYTPQADLATSLLRQALQRFRCA